MTSSARRLVVVLPALAAAGLLAWLAPYMAMTVRDARARVGLDREPTCVYEFAPPLPPEPVRYRLTFALGATRNDGHCRLVRLQALPASQSEPRR